MQEILGDFVSREPRRSSFQIGRKIASALSGFIAGMIVMGIIWFVVRWANLLASSAK